MRGFRRTGAALVLLALTLCACGPQHPRAQLLPSPAPIAQATPAQGSQAPTPAPPPSSSQPIPQRLPGESKARISNAEAQELFASVKTILEWVSDETRLPIHEPVKPELTSRAELQRFIEENLNKSGGTERLRRSQLVLMKFGLLPRTFELEPFLVRLLREQVLGFYDPDKKKMFLLDWVDPQAQKPVLAHELTHALQDQNFNLTKWLRAGQKPPADDPASVGKEAADHSANSPKDPPDLSESDKPADIEREIDEEEKQTAREAVSEGQGMITMLDYVLQPLNRNVLQMPEYVQQMTDAMMSGKDSPVFQSAPLFLQEVLTFPYRYGLTFERELLFRGGPKLAFDGALRNPPVNSREILEPKTYLAGERVTPLHVPDIAATIAPQYQHFDVGGMGEFDVKLLLEQFSGERAADRLARDWRGGYYYAAKKKGSDAKTTSDVALVYVSKWATPKAAQDFAGFYAASLAKKYRTAAPIRDERGAQTGKWMTDEGPVYIESVADHVFISESFDDATAKKLRDVTMSSAAPAQ